MTPIIDVTDVTRTFGSGPTATAALRGVNMTVGEGQLVALRGRSGSGKTTLLNIVGGLDAPDSGAVRIDGKDVTSMSEQQRVHLRRETVAYIFQSFSLLPGLSAAENAGVPLRIAGMAPKAREERVATMLTLVGLADEPTGQLDAETGKQIMRLIRSVVRSEGVTALLATHDPTLMDIADSVLHLTDGTILQES
ncbi:ABC transporter ATP-binding protein [Trebonia sp.]|uniref:ABC transporter ATP-binding protein n=2 Tax=Trebonia sp. TaxID=2767075 RepID=UPI003CC59BED